LKARQAGQGVIQNAAPVAWRRSPGKLHACAPTRDGAALRPYIKGARQRIAKARTPATMDILQIVFFAGLAVFLAVRLYMALGRPSGRTHEEHVREERERVADPGPAAKGFDRASDRPAPSQAFAGAASDGLSAIAAVDRNFDPETFSAGAGQAYEMIVVAYANGEKDTLQPLLSERVFKAYGQAIDARAEAGQTMTTEIERLKSSKIVEASLNDNRARVKVAFSAEIASELRDPDGKAVEGDLSRLKTVDEVWSFERDVTSENPNWRLAGVKPA
jgi:predicted lipid-binding transport protein (Tim44 family)